MHFGPHHGGGVRWSGYVAASTVRSPARLLSTRPALGRTPFPEQFIAVPLPSVRPASARVDAWVDPDIDPTISCAACDAVCCRLTVVLLPGDDVPERLTTWTDEGLHVMAHDEDGWCVAVDGARHCCSIYETRPAICRKFAMGGPYCRAVRAEYAAESAAHSTRNIPLALC